MKSYLILIFLTVFSVILSICATFGTFPAVEVPTIVVTLSEQDLNDLSGGLMENLPTYLYTLGGTGINVLLTSLTSVLFVYAILAAIGVPSVIALGIQSIIYVVYAWDIVTWLTQRYKPSN